MVSRDMGGGDSVKTDSEHGLECCCYKIKSKVCASDKHCSLIGRREVKNSMVSGL
jgi:hypothetical protein